MERSPVRDIEIKYLLKSAMTDKIDDFYTYSRGIDQSYLYENYCEFKLEELLKKDQKR